MTLISMDYNPKILLDLFINANNLYQLRKKTRDDISK